MNRLHALCLLLAVLAVHANALSLTNLLKLKVLTAKPAPVSPTSVTLTGGLRSLTVSYGCGASGAADCNPLNANMKYHIECTTGVDGCPSYTHDSTIADGGSFTFFPVHHGSYSCQVRAQDNGVQADFTQASPSGVIPIGHHFFRSKDLDVTYSPAVVSRGRGEGTPATCTLTFTIPNTCGVNIIGFDVKHRLRPNGVAVIETVTGSTSPITIDGTFIEADSHYGFHVAVIDQNNERGGWSDRFILETDADD